MRGGGWWSWSLQDQTDTSELINFVMVVLVWCTYGGSLHLRLWVSSRREWRQGRVKGTALMLFSWRGGCLSLSVANAGWWNIQQNKKLFCEIKVPLRMYVFVPRQVLSRKVLSEGKIIKVVHQLKRVCVCVVSHGPRRRKWNHEPTNRIYLYI